MNIRKTKLVFGTLRRRKVTKGLVLHHIAGRTATPEQIHREHVRRGWQGAGYHVYVRKDGSAWELRPLWAVGSHAGSRLPAGRGNNTETVAVAVEGMYHSSGREAADKEMPAAQYNMLVGVIKYIMTEYPSIEWIRGHREMPGVATVCPGEFFPLDKIKADATAPAIRAGSTVRVRPEAKRWATGQVIPAWVKDSIYTVTQVSVDETRALLSDVHSWIFVTDLIHAEKSLQAEKRHDD